MIVAPDMDNSISDFKVFVEFAFRGEHLKEKKSYSIDFQ